MVAAAMLIAASPAPAATRYAEPGGNGPAATCPQPDPCDIQTAIEDASVQGLDEVVLLPGTYAVGSDEIDVNDSLDIHGQAGSPPPEIDSSSNTAISVYSASTLRRLIINHSGSATGVTLSALSTVERVVVDSSAPGGYACTGLDITIRDSVCWDHGTDGIGVGVYWSGPGAPRSFTLRNVTAVGGLYGIYDEAISGGTFSVDAKSVIAKGGTKDVYAAADATSTANVTLDHSNYATESHTGAGTVSVTAPGTGSNQTAPPVFTDAANGDFHQLLGSPTIDAGVVDGSSGSLDIDDEQRTIGTAPDIGADEFDPTPPETTITRHPRARTTSRKAKFKFRSDLLPATFECNLDGAGYESCSSPQVYEGLKRDKHVFKVRATHYGLADPTPAKFAWKITR
jgi:hypothetical protein